MTHVKDFSKEIFFMCLDVLMVFRLYWFGWFSTNGPKIFVRMLFRCQISYSNSLLCCLCLWIRFCRIKLFFRKTLEYQCWIYDALLKLTAYAYAQFVTKPWGIVNMFAATILTTQADQIYSTFWRNFHIFHFQLCI